MRTDRSAVCDGKNHYASKLSARRAAISLRASGLPGRLDVYACPYCLTSDRPWVVGLIARSVLRNRNPRRIQARAAGPTARH